MRQYYVGGCVRDVLLGKDPVDLDIVVVGSTPDEMISLGFTPVGESFPVFLKNGIEYALARTERKTGNGYHGFSTDFNPEVTLREDTYRRDLTINAMAVAVEHWDDFLKTRSEQFVIDYHGGLIDLEDGRLLPVALDTFVEDPLRIIRAARFEVRYGMQWTNRLQEAAEEVVASGELEHITAERFCLEFEKVVNQTTSLNAIRKFKRRMFELGIMTEHMSAPLDRLEQLGIRDDMEVPSSVRAAELFGSTIPATMNEVRAAGMDIQHRFKLSNDMIGQVCDVVKFLDILLSKRAPLPCDDDIGASIRMMTFSSAADNPKMIKLLAELSSVNSEFQYQVTQVVECNNVMKMTRAADVMLVQPGIAGPALGKAIRDIRLKAVNEILKTSQRA